MGATALSNYHAWIFISHASDDIAQVRQVRNYLEAKGASPLLFHLLALKEPEEFWPIIEKEIEARNFFLYCDSETAALREWVRRERAWVEAVARKKPVRIGSIRVDRAELNIGHLDLFLAKTRVFPSFSRQDHEKVRPFLQALEEAGFQVFDEETGLVLGDDWRAQIKEEIKLVARDGWVIAFLSAFSLKSPWVQVEIDMVQSLGAKFIPVAIERVEAPPELARIQVFDATADPVSAPRRLVNEMLSRPV